MSSNDLVAFGGVGLLGLIAFLIDLHLIRRDEARRRADRAKE
jgi:hypothetical protein